MVLTAAAVLLTAAPPARAAAGDLSFYALPTAGAGPHGATLGPDGAIWFTERSVAQLGRLDPTTGAVTEFWLPGADDPTEIAAGPDGALWFTESDGNAIGRLTPTGDLFIELGLQRPGSAPTGIAAGSDARVWFTERGSDLIGRIDPLSGDLVEFPTLTPGGAPTGIAAGDDGAMWFTERDADRIGRIDVDGEVTEHLIPTSGGLPSGIAEGPDDAMWFTLPGTNEIGRIATADGTVTTFPLPTPGANPAHIAAGPDGALWFTEEGIGAIGRIETNGAVVEFPVGESAAVRGIVRGPDTAMWFAEPGTDSIGRIDATPEPHSAPDVTPPTIAVRSPANGDWTTLGATSLLADYDCADEEGGSGIATCAGPAASGQAVPAASLGAQTFTVDAGDVAGNPATVSTQYLVFRSVTGSVLTAGPQRAGSVLTLTLGMDLARRFDPIVTAQTQLVDCANGGPIGAPETADIRWRVANDGSLEIRWDTNKTWANRCRTLTVSFGAPGWSGPTASFDPISFTPASRNATDATNTTRHASASR